MEVISHEVDTLESKVLPMKEIMLFPISDIHYGSDACDWDRFKKHIAYAARFPNAYFIGLGDYIDLASPSNRGKLLADIKQGGLYDTIPNSLDRVMDTYLKDLKEVLKPTRGRWIGLLEGHHFWQYQDGVTSDMKLCDFLNCPFLGTSSMVQVKFRHHDLKKKYTMPYFTIFAHHGRGGGRTQSAPLNLLEHVVKAFDADVYLIAHQHKKVSAKMHRIGVHWGNGNGHLMHKNLILACTGGFLKGYQQGSLRENRAQGGYVEKSLMNPVALGSIIIYARPVVKHGYTRVDLDVTI